MVVGTVALMTVGVQGGARGEATLSYRSGGATIGVERFDAAGGSSRPAILLLHGADGLTFGERYRYGARILASAGYHVFMIHYLDRTGESRASYGTIGQNFAAWTDTLRDAVSFVAGQPGVARGRIGMLGTSLGGALAIETAAGDPRVTAVANYFGFVPRGLAERAKRLPPTLILHGERDAIVPVANAYQLQALLQKRGAPHEIKVYPDQGHGFSGEAQLDAAQRTAAFFARYLDGQARERVDAGAALAQ